MPLKGYPDNFQPEFELAASDDTPINAAWLANRFALLDNRGRLLHFDAFGSTLAQYALSLVGGGSAPDLVNVTTYADGSIFVPPNCVRFRPGAAAGGSSVLTKYLPKFYYDRYGVEICFVVRQNMPYWNVDFRYFNNAGTGKRGQYYIDPGSGILHLAQFPATVLYRFETLTADSLRFVIIRLVVDFAQERHERMIVNGEVIPMTQYPLLNSPGNGYNRIALVITAANNGAATVAGQIGYIAITGDEPAQI